MTKEPLKTDVVIIGAGPVGLFAIFELGMLNIRCHVVDALEYAGGQCAALYPEKPIFDIAGYPHIEAQELVQRLQEQAAPFFPRYHFGQQVTALAHKEDGWLVTTSAQQHIWCKAVVIAAGCGAFGPNRPPLENIEQYEGKSLFYSVQKKETFKGRNVVIAGGGDSAADWAIELAGIARSVKVVHRRPKFRCLPQSQQRLHALAQEKKIELVIPYQLYALHGKDGVLEAVEVCDLGGSRRLLEADILLPFYGLSMELGPIATWGLNLDMNRIAVSPATCQTNRQGIFAIGDIAHYPAKLKLIVCGFSEAAMAAHAIYPLVHPDKALHFEYSTTKGLPQGATS